jgi:hypothetical protein
MRAPRLFVCGLPPFVQRADMLRCTVAMVTVDAGRAKPPAAVGKETRS